MFGAPSDRRACLVEPDEDTRRARVVGLVAELGRVVDAWGQAAPPPQHEAVRHVAVVHRLDVGGLGAAVDRIRLAQRTSASPGMWVTLEGQGRSTSAWLPQAAAWEAQPLVVELLVRLHGDELEIDASLAGEHPILPHSTFVHPDGWWPAFKARALDDRTLGEVYRERLYAAVEAVVGRGGARVLDLGAGDGELAVRLLAGGHAARVTLVDRNQALLAEARTRLSGTATDVIDADLASVEGWARVPSSFDVVVAVGFFESNVVTTPVAANALAEAVSRLAPGGVLVVTGTGAALVHRAQLEALGLTVTNTTLPAPVVRGATYPFYVARRSD